MDQSELLGLFRHRSEKYFPGPDGNTGKVPIDIGLNVNSSIVFSLGFEWPEGKYVRTCMHLYKIAAHAKNYHFRINEINKKNKSRSPSYINVMNRTCDIYHLFLFFFTVLP